MSVELTGRASDILSVKPQQGQESERDSIKNLTDSRPSIENKLIAPKTAEDVHQLNKRATKDEKEVMTTPQLEKVAEKLQEFIGKMNRGLEFSVDEDSGRDVIKVIDKHSGVVIKQYPSEEVLSLVAKLSEATGNFVDSKI
jgi:flagellar protein FlaG